MQKNILKNSLLVSGILLSGPALASGYAIDTSPTLFGMAMAGASVYDNDLSGMHYNAANMGFMEGNQVYGGFILLSPDIKYDNAVGTFAGSPIGGLAADGHVGPPAFVPAGFAMYSIDPAWKVGLAVTAPWGLTTRYDQTWAGRFFAVDSELDTININPSVAWEITPWWSVAGGFQAQYFKARLTQLPGGPVGELKLEGTSWGYGYTAGTTFKIGPAVRLGVGYVSDIGTNISGTESANHIFEASATAKLHTPEKANIGASWQVNDQWEVLGEADWTRWNRFQNLTIASAGGDEVVENNWKNSWLFALGAQFQATDCWKFRFGAAYDVSPTNDEFRNPTIPDSDRILASVGATLKVNKNVDVHLGYTHLFFQDTSVNLTSDPFGPIQTLSADYQGNVDIITTGFNWRFG